MNGWISALIIVLTFAGSAFFSGVETGGYLVNRIRLRARVHQGERSARRLQEILRDPHRFIFTVLISNNIANYLLSREVTRLYSGAILWNAETAATLTLMIPLFIFGELIPKNIFRHHADALMLSSSLLLRRVQQLLSPLTGFLKALFAGLTGGRSRREERGGFSLSLQGFREYFAEGPRRDLLSAHQHGMIDNLVAMHRVPVRQIMTPVAAMAQTPEKGTVRQAAGQMRARNVDWVAVYRGPARQATGFVHLFDLMAPGIGPDDPVKPFLHKTIRVSEATQLTRAFRRLRTRRQQTAVVVDRSGRVTGLLHIRDIARYIVQ
jgi:putative hemolysin